MTDSFTDKSFPELQAKLDELAKAYVNSHPDFVAFAQANDPALDGKSEADLKAELATYPGVIAIAAHDLAYELYKHDDKVAARALAEAAHSRTGIDIHPGTRIAANCFIDHGTGDVIGETARIGEHTVIYHGVTLGAFGRVEDKAHRHPELGSNCVISTGVQVLGNAKLGNKVVVGPGARIMGNNVQIGDGVSVGAGAQIGEGNIIEANVRIGVGVVIPPAPAGQTRTISSDMLKLAGVENGYDKGALPTSIVATSVELGSVQKLVGLFKEKLKEAYGKLGIDTLGLDTGRALT